jgi:hypothetical protein
MKKVRFLGLPILFFLYLFIVVPFQSCKPDDTEDECDSCIIAYKPNIYIYPKEPIQLLVKLNFPMGGNIITSIPEYGTGWNVLVDTSGLINNSYNYLFYESTQPDIWQRKYGWVIQIDELESFFRQNMVYYGFKGREIDDFIEYWIPRLIHYPLYSIYPQTNNLVDNVIQLNFSKQPKNILRLFYVIKGQHQLQDKLTVPTIDSFIREGYFVTEWGVILK